jgi:hypothetical protein
MKKLLVGVIFLSIVNLILLVLIYGKVRFVVDDFVLFNKCDTTINKVRIDSIEYIIKSKDSIINKIKYNEKEYSKKIDALDDDANVKLFKELVSN